MCRAAEPATEALPTPTIKIDNTSDPFATVIKVDFGDRLGELLDTVRAPRSGARAALSLTVPAVRRQTVRGRASP